MKKYTTKDFTGINEGNKGDAKNALREFARIWGEQNNNSPYFSLENDCFVKDFYKNVEVIINGKEEKDIRQLKKTEDYTIKIHIGDGNEVKLNVIRTLGNIAEKSHVSPRHYVPIAIAYNNLYSAKTGYYITKDWHCDSINGQIGKRSNNTGNEEANKQRIAKYKYDGQWQGVQFYSREKRHYLREFGLEIDTAGNTTLSNKNTNGDLETIEGRVSVGSTGRQLFCEFEHFDNADADPYISRILYCLEKDNNLIEGNELCGSYAGFSREIHRPYGGAIFLKKMDPGKKPILQNIPVDDQKMDTWESGIEGLKKAYYNYLDSPDKSFSKQLHAKFRNYELNTELSGNFLTIGIGSGGSNGALNTLVSYPMYFEAGLCTTYGVKKSAMTSPVRAVGKDNRHIWVHLREEKSATDLFTLTNISYFIDDDHKTQNEFNGISYRINGKHQLQARTELLIRVDDGEPKIRKLYQHGDIAYKELRNKYYKTHPFFKELINAFEDMIKQKTNRNHHILQNNTHRSGQDKKKK